jgi:hypothetical protein
VGQGWASFFFGNGNRGLVPGNGNRTSAGYRWPGTQRMGSPGNGNRESAPFPVTVTGPPFVTMLRPTLALWVWVRRAYQAAASVPVTSFREPWSSGPENVALCDNQNEILVALLLHLRGRDPFSRSACSHAPHLWQSHQRCSCEQREGCPCGSPSQARHRANDHPLPGITSSPKGNIRQISSCLSSVADLSAQIPLGQQDGT